MADLREALKGDDAPSIAAKTNTLTQASNKLGEAIYSQPQDRSGKQDTAPNRSGENIVDADFTEVDDDNNKRKSA